MQPKFYIDITKKERVGESIISNSVIQLSSDEYIDINSPGSYSGDGNANHLTIKYNKDVLRGDFNIMDLNMTLEHLKVILGGIANNKLPVDQSIIDKIDEEQTSLYLSIGTYEDIYYNYPNILILRDGYTPEDLDVSYDFYRDYIYSILAAFKENTGEYFTKDTKGELIINYNTLLSEFEFEINNIDE